jgi:DnaD/phage-associated family protein
MAAERHPPAPAETRAGTFGGFPRGVRYVPVPSPVLDELLTQIDDLAELKCVLRVIWLLQRKRGSPRFVTLSEVLADRTLAAALSPDGAPDPDAVRRALGRAVRRGVLATTVIPAKAGTDGSGRRLFALNSEQDRVALARQAGDDAAASRSREPAPWEAAVERPNIFAIYEDNVGMITPMIAEELERAEADYPTEWIEDAVREAVSHNRRSWRYIARILERWKHEGKDDGESGTRTAKTSRY